MKRFADLSRLAVALIMVGAAGPVAAQQEGWFANSDEGLVLLVEPIGEVAQFYLLSERRQEPMICEQDPRVLACNIPFIGSFTYTLEGSTIVEQQFDEISAEYIRREGRFVAPADDESQLIDLQLVGTEEGQTIVTRTFWGIEAEAIHTVDPDNRYQVTFESMPPTASVTLVDQGEDWLIEVRDSDMGEGLLGSFVLERLGEGTVMGGQAAGVVTAGIETVVPTTPVVPRITLRSPRRRGAGPPWQAVPTGSRRIEGAFQMAPTGTAVALDYENGLAILDLVSGHRTQADRGDGTPLGIATWSRDGARVAISFAEGGFESGYTEVVTVGTDRVVTLVWEDGYPTTETWIDADRLLTGLGGGAGSFTSIVMTTLDAHGADAPESETIHAPAQFESIPGRLAHDPVTGALYGTERVWDADRTTDTALVVAQPGDARFTSVSTVAGVRPTPERDDRSSDLLFDIVGRGQAALMAPEDGLEPDVNRLYTIDLQSLTVAPFLIDDESLDLFDFVVGPRATTVAAFGYDPQRQRYLIVAREITGGAFSGPMFELATISPADLPEVEGADQPERWGFAVGWSADGQIAVLDVASGQILTFELR